MAYPSQFTSLPIEFSEGVHRSTLNARMGNNLETYFCENEHRILVKYTLNRSEKGDFIKNNNSNYLPKVEFTGVDLDLSVNDIFHVENKAYKINSFSFSMNDSEFYLWILINEF